MSLFVDCHLFHLKKEGPTMQRNTFTHRLAASFCLLMLSILLLLSGCGGYSNPGSQPNGTPQATPTQGGYSIIYTFDKEIQLLLPLQKR